MKKCAIDARTKLLATKDNKRRINYYIVTPGKEKFYAFTRPYCSKTWDMCKAGIGIYDLMTTRTRDTSVMLLVKYTKYIMPYLCEEYGLIAV